VAASPAEEGRVIALYVAAALVAWFVVSCAVGVAVGPVLAAASR